MSIRMTHTPLNDVEPNDYNAWYKTICRALELNSQDQIELFATVNYKVTRERTKRWWQQNGHHKRRDMRRAEFDLFMRAIALRNQQNITHLKKVAPLAED
jgi:hypothetical protein